MLGQICFWLTILELKNFARILCTASGTNAVGVGTNVVISQTHWLVSQVRLAQWRESLALLNEQCCHLSRGGSNSRLVCHTTSCSHEADRSASREPLEFVPESRLVEFLEICVKQDKNHEKIRNDILASVAPHLARRPGHENTFSLSTCFFSCSLAGGTSWLAAGLIGFLRGTRAERSIFSYSAKLYQDLEEAGYKTGQHIHRQDELLLLFRSCLFGAPHELCELHFVVHTPTTHRYVESAEEPKSRRVGSSAFYFGTAPKEETRTPVGVHTPCHTAGKSSRKGIVYKLLKMLQREGTVIIHIRTFSPCDFLFYLLTCSLQVLEHDLVGKCKRSFRFELGVCSYEYVHW